MFNANPVTSYIHTFGANYGRVSGILPGLVSKEY
jgi:hypothetical protein